MAYLDETGLAYYDSKLKQWIEGPDSDIAHKTGDETLEGVKTFQNTASGHIAGETVTDLIIRNPEVDRGTPVEGGRSYTRVILADREGDTEETYAGRLGLLEVVSPKENDTSGEELRLGCYKYSDNSADYSKYAGFRTGYDKNAIPFSTAPATSNERTEFTDIVTRGYMEASEWNWQKTKKNALVQFKPVPESDLEPAVDFMFTETPPASGEKGPENPSTITGVTETNVVMCGNNLFKFFNYNSNTVNGVTCTADASGIITLNGTAASNASFQQYFIPVIPINSDTTVFCSYEIISGTYTLPTGSQTAFLVQDVATKTGSSSVYLGVNNTLPDGTQKYIPSGYKIAGANVVAYSGASFNDLKIKAQIEIGTKKTSWESPVFSNYTIQLGDTYYGGSLDVATGVMTVTHTAIKIGDYASSITYDSTNNRWQFFATPRADYAVEPTCSNSVFNQASWATETDGVFRWTSGGSGTWWWFRSTAETLNDFLDVYEDSYIVYKLYEPQTVQLTPTQIQSLPALDKYEPRINTVYTDQEAVQVGYQRFYDENRIAAIEARLDALEGN